MSIVARKMEDVKKRFDVTVQQIQQIEDDLVQLRTQAAQLQGAYRALEELEAEMQKQQATAPEQPPTPTRPDRRPV